MGRADDVYVKPPPLDVGAHWDAAREDDATDPLAQLVGAIRGADVYLARTKRFSSRWSTAVDP